jgi:hypothetical protein
MTTVNRRARKTEYKAHMEPHVTQIHSLMSPQNYGCKIISEEREKDLMHMPKDSTGKEWNS